MSYIGFLTGVKLSMGCVRSGRLTFQVVLRLRFIPCELSTTLTSFPGQYSFARVFRRKCDATNLHSCASY